MSLTNRIECVGCGHSVLPSQTVDFGTFVLCLECHQEMFEQEEDDRECEDWARVNAEEGEDVP